MDATAPRRREPWLGIGIKLAAVAALLLATNAGLVQRLELLLDQGRMTTLLFFLAVWGLCAGALVVAAFQPNRWVRFGWAGALALATAVGLTFRWMSQTDFGVMEAVSLWEMRQEASRATAFYGANAGVAALVAVATLVVIAAPPTLRHPLARRWLTRLAFVPALPVAAIAAIMFMKDGGGSQALPVQFTPLSVAVVSTASLASNPVPARREVAWAPGERLSRNVVMLVDESIRGDYVDFTPGNTLTPRLAEHRDRIVDFGLATSGSTCSLYSNVMFRFAAARRDLGGPLRANPTIWQYAKAAGYRTVFIDAQAAFVKDPGKLHSFMTLQEFGDIDGFYNMQNDVPAPELDFRLLEVIAEELKSDRPVFIYAIKNGVHFPYDMVYPAAGAPFEPTMTTSPEDSTAARVNSYRNALRHNVDGFFARLFSDIDLADTSIIYTSDHGQVFDPARFTHCSTKDPDPREGIVPLFAITGDPALDGRFTQAAADIRDRGSHFLVVPTLLELMGYRAGDVRAAFGGSMFAPGEPETAFTYGDVMGLVSPAVNWQPVDLSVPRLEAEALTPEHPATAGQAAPAAAAMTQ